MKTKSISQLKKILELAIEKIWLKIILKKIWFFFWKEEREKQQNDTKLKIFRKSNTNFFENDTKLRIFTDQKGIKDMQIRKLKEK